MYIFSILILIAAVMLYHLSQTRIYDLENRFPPEPRDPWLLLVSIVLGVVGIAGIVILKWPKQ